MSKNWHFPKGLTHGFGPNMAIFQTFFFRQYRLGNVFYGILDRKNAFLGYKNKIEVFPKGLTHGFGPNMATFPTFF